jgi:hypothetical protein
VNRPPDSFWIVHALSAVTVGLRKGDHHRGAELQPARRRAARAMITNWSSFVS